MLIDYHMHTPLCRHAVGQPWEYAEHAVRVGLTEIGFSDHCPMPGGYDAAFRMTADQMDEYLQMVEEARRRHPLLSIKLGIEADFYPGSEDYVRDLLGSYPFDFVLGSVHYIGDWGFDNPELIEGFSARHLEAIWKDYFELLARAAASRLFDVLAHPDLVKKFGHRASGDLSRFYRPVIAEMKKAGTALEVSAAGLRKTVAEIYPSLEFMRLARDAGVPITFASDAHAPGEVGDQFDRLVAAASQAGYTTITRFTGRVPEQVPMG